eukprot:6213161-Pleurochrysis_carterae.AAC.2
MNLQGLSISWSELWSKLRRLPRAPTIRGQQHPVHMARTAQGQRVCGGINHAKAAKKAANARVATQAYVNELPESSEVDEDIIAGGLYFIEISDFEGEACGARTSREGGRGCGHCSCVVAPGAARMEQ